MNEMNSESILSALRSSASSGFLDSFKHTLETSVDQILSHYDAKLSEIHAEAQTAESAIRISINRTFQAMKARHIAELEQIEFAKAIEIRAKSQQRLAPVRDLQEQAKCYARAHELGIAIQIRGEAAKLLKEERNSRMTQTEMKYAVLSERMIERQGIEVENLQQFLCDQLIETRGKCESGIRLRKRKTVVLIHRQLVGVIGAARKGIKGKVDYAAILTEFLENKLLRENRGELFVEL
jgi:hypothetical protein